MNILLIEDTEELGEMIYDLLTIEGFKVSWAKNGKSGIELYQQENFHLIVTDIVMPQMNGLQVIQFIRTSIKSPEIPIIILSAKASPEDQQAGFAAGANIYLKKPCNSKELIHSIRSLLFIERT